VLFIGVLFGRVFSKAKYVSVFLITLGISMFMLQKVRNKQGEPEARDAAALWIGRALLLGSLACDGITGALQDKLVGHSKPSAYHLMLYNNLWAAVYLFLALLVSGRLLPGALFVWHYPAILELMCVFALCSAAGQLFIYYAVRHHGSLVCTMITTTRKFFTILLSVVWFGHVLGLVQWLAVVVVFAGLALDTYFSAKAKKSGAPKKSE
jgi:UDP-galactose transporter B1